MDIPQGKDQKLASELKDGQNEDWISKMPDSILCKVLSLLPVGEAVRTSILSSKWRYLWAHTPTLHFVMPRYNDRLSVQRYMNFVDGIVVLRNGTQIQNFRFHGARNCDYTRIYALLCNVVKFHVQVLDIQVLESRRRGLKLPLNDLMNYRALVELKLSRYIFLDVPAHVCFPSLKTLELRSVNYSGEESVGNLFSGCPVLEELLVDRCLKLASDNIEAYNVSVASLKKLTLMFRLESHPCFGNDCKFSLRIHTPKLEYLYVTDHMSTNFSVTSTLFNLVEAYVDVQRTCRIWDGQYNLSVFGLISTTYMVKSLSLSGVTLRSLGFAFQNNLPRFNDLVYLSLGVDESNGWFLLPTFLHNTPNLEELIFADGLGCWWVFDDLPFPFNFNWNPPPNVPSCLTSNLKRVIIDGLSVGSKEELKLIKYLLENAGDLARMTISRFRAKPNIRNKLLRFPKASLSCELIIS